MLGFHGLFQLITEGSVHDVTGCASCRRPGGRPFHCGEQAANRQEFFPENRGRKTVTDILPHRRHAAISAAIAIVPAIGLAKRAFQPVAIDAHGLAAIVAIHIRANPGSRRPAQDKTGRRFDLGARFHHGIAAAIAAIIKSALTVFEACRRLWRDGRKIGALRHGRTCCGCNSQSHEQHAQSVQHCHLFRRFSRVRQ